MADHIVKSYEKELSSLDIKLSHMGGLAEHLINAAYVSLESRNPKLAKEIVENDLSVDLLHKEIEDQSISILARRHPVANDLRRVISVLKVCGELERIGDLAKNCAKRAITISEFQYPQLMLTGLRSMVELASSQLNQVLDAFILKDAHLAYKVWIEDEKLDRLYNSLFREFLTYMMEDRQNVGLCTHLLFFAKNLERIGDHATNMAESITYMTNAGRTLQERPKSDLTATLL